MLRLEFTGIRELAVRDVEEPPLGSRDVRVRVHSVGICKSDVYGYMGVNGRRKAAVDATGGRPLVMGHEAAGVIVEVGSEVTDPAVGQRVALNPLIGCGGCEFCRAGFSNVCLDRRVLGCVVDVPGAYAEQVVVPAENALPLGQGVPLEWAALVEPIAVGAQAVAHAQVVPGASKILVIGGGIIGIGAALSAQRLQPDELLVIEPIEGRREMLNGFGIEAIAPDAPGRGARFDIVVDCVATPRTIEYAIESLRPRGCAVLVGITSDTIPLPVSALVENERRLIGSYGSTPAQFAEVVAWVSSGDLDLSALVQGRVGFDGLIQTFERYADGSLNAVRTLFQPTEA